MCIRDSNYTGLFLHCQLISSNMQVACIQEFPWYKVTIKKILQHSFLFTIFIYYNKKKTFYCLAFAIDLYIKISFFWVDKIILKFCGMFRQYFIIYDVVYFYKYFYVIFIYKKLLPVLYFSTSFIYTCTLDNCIII